MFGDKRPLIINRPFIGCCLVDAAHGWFHKSFPIAHMGRWAPMEPICLTISRMMYIIVFGTIHSVVMVRTLFENIRRTQDPMFALNVSGWIIQNTNIVLRQCGCGHSAGAHPLPIGENTYSPGGLDLTSCVAIPLWRLKCFLHRRRQACALALIAIIV